MAELSETERLINTVDGPTRKRVGSLSAHGLLDQQIADALLLTLDQVLATKQTVEFREQFAKVANEEIEKQIDLAEGWDRVEEKALASVLDTLEYSKNPDYALKAAVYANKAERRKNNNKDTTHVIDNSKTINNIVVLQLNKGYLNKLSDNSSEGLVDVTPRPALTQKKVSDLPSPKAVEALLAPVKDTPRDAMYSEIDQLMKAQGVFIDDFEAKK